MSSPKSSKQTQVTTQLQSGDKTPFSLFYQTTHKQRNLIEMLVTVKVDQNHTYRHNHPNASKNMWNADLKTFSMKPKRTGTNQNKPMKTMPFMEERSIIYKNCSAMTKVSTFSVKQS